MYKYLKKWLFLLQPESAHHYALESLALAKSLKLQRFFSKPAQNVTTVMGLTFPNQIGLAAGFDKNGDYIDALAMLGFGFLEIGTVTPKPQPGNPKPRLFRLTPEQAILNRMGFNNKGVEHMAAQLEKKRYQGILGINIGKNKDTPNAKAIDDYIFCFRRLATYASYITVNISSPNTPGLRELQSTDYLHQLLDRLKQEQAAISRYVPLVVKIAPDLSDQALAEMAEVFLAKQIDGVIATNTTLSRQGVEKSPFKTEAGGLSGKPLTAMSTEVVRKLFAILGERIPIIASGGVMDVESAQAKVAAGAKLVQVYSGLIYTGPGIVSQLAARLVLDG